MNAEIFAEWLRRQGLQVARTPSSYWVHLGKRVWQAFPYHWLIAPGEAEIREFLLSHAALGLRYSTPFRMSGGCPSYHIVYEQPTYSLENLQRQTRNNIRLGLKKCSLSTMPFTDLEEAGWQLQIDTFKRQGRMMPIKEKGWRLMCKAAENMPGFEAWGAFVGTRLAAAAITFHLEDCFYVLHQMSHRDFMPLRVNNALFFTITNEALNRPAVKRMFLTLQSLDAPASVDEFKFRMGYAAKPVRQRVVFHPLVQPFINQPSHALLRRLLKWRPGNPTLAKAEGMVRFYREGKRPLAEQQWPECLNGLQTMSPRGSTREYVRR
jgi:hypothetical protein